MVVFNRLFAAFCMSLAIVTAEASQMSLSECKERAAKGDAEAMWQLGQRYENGDGIRKDNLKALSQYRKAAEKGHAEACGRLAELYETGKIVGKDLVNAARYRAMAKGESVELAAEKAELKRQESKVDEIEVALDYILGRNGKAKDPRSGIRILYAQAKDNPTAQKVFVDRWSKGDLDDALGVLSPDEWNLLLPWFRDAWNRGKKDAGLILGNDAYRRKQYDLALKYWQGCNLPKGWYFVGRFYDSWAKEGDGGGPASMRNDTLARRAYERCLKIDNTWDNAKFYLGLIHLFAKRDEDLNYRKALEIFSYFLKKAPDDKWYNYDYGLAGYWLQRSQFDRKWPKRRVETLLSWAKLYESSQVPEYDRRTMLDYNRMLDDWKSMEQSQEKFVSYIRKASSLGCESAQKFMADYNDRKQSR